MSPVDLETRLIAERFASFEAARAHEWDRAGEIVFAVIVGVLATFAVLKWLEPCAEAALCMAPAVVPTRRNPLVRLWQWCRLEHEARMLRWRIQLAEEDVRHFESDLLILPMQIKSHESAIGAWRVQLVDAERAIADVRWF